MSDKEVIEAISKLQYHVSLLGQSIDYEKYPVEYLVISMNWDRDDLNKAHDIFEKWEKVIEQGHKISSAEFENDFSNELGISYQGVKSVILAFYRNGQWTDVCEAYVDSFGGSPALEYHSIMRRER